MFNIQKQNKKLYTNSVTIKLPKDIQIRFNSKGRFSYMYFHPYSLMESDYFINVFKSNINKLSENNLYSILIKTKFFDGTFRMLSSQFGFYYNLDELTKFEPHNSEFSYVFNNNFNNRNPVDEFKTYDRPLNLNELYIYIISLLQTLNENYDLDNMEYVCINFLLFKPYKPILKNIYKVPLNKDFINVTRSKFNFSSKLLPLSLDESLYGKKMFSTLNKIRFYSTSRSYINEDNQTKVIVTDISEIQTKKEVFSIKTNKLLETIIDTKNNTGGFSRKINNLELTIHNNKVLQTQTSISLPSIKPKEKNIHNTFNKNIGTFDVETYLDLNSNTTKIYALGYSHVNENIDNPIVKLFYISPDQDSASLVITCINEMLQTKYNKTIFYTHNLGGYDVIYIYNILEKYNEKQTTRVYDLKPEYRDNVLLKLTITSGVSILPRNKQVINKSRKINQNSITLVDSLNLLPDSLDNLSIQFTSKHKKTYFPYSFVTNNTLYYKGETPSIEYYNTEKKKINKTIYNNLIKPDWNIVEETKFYLKNDLLSLLNIMYEFNKFIFNEFTVEVTDNLTITGISLDYFLSNHYNKYSPLPLLNNKSLYKDIKKAYYGGLSVVYKPYGENLNYYDVNSLYPAMSLKSMIGNKCVYIEDFTSKGLELNNLFGFFYCTIKTNNDYLGLLPYRDKGLLTYPIGEWSGWFFTPLLELVSKHGYDVKIHKGYNFNKVDNVFKSYVEKLYNIKKTSTGSKKLIAKYLLNSLLGRFGMDIDKWITMKYTKEEYLKIISTHVIFDEKWISSDCVILTYSPEINYSICKQHDEDYIEKLNTQNIDSEYSRSFNNVSVGISAAITGYSSVFMSEIKLLIKSLGGNIYYMDTDSIVTDIKLPDNLVGSDLGLFKLEHENIKRGYFITSKTYCLITKDNKEIVKSKGVYKESLNELDFIQLLLDKDINSIKGNSVKNYELGYVIIGTKKVKVRSDSYRKRIKIYDSDTGLWVDTRPLVVNSHVNLSLILWENMFSLVAI